MLNPPRTAAFLALLLCACSSTVTRGEGSNDGAGATGATGTGASDTGDTGGTAGASNVGGDVINNTGGESDSWDPPDYIEPTDCKLLDVTVTPSELSPTDVCDADYLCAGNIVLAVVCDGENDGSGTSLCECHLDGAQKDGGLVDGEGETACANGYPNCVAQR